jgi:hypothetical protein
MAKDYEWKISLEKEGITVYTSKVEGSDFDAFKGTIEVNASLNTVASVIRDVPAYPEWIYMTSSATLLNSEGNVFYLYSISKSPWPVSPRDIVYESRMVQNPETKEILITMKGVPDYIPKKDDFVRIDKADGFWLLTPIEGNRVRVTFQMNAEPGGKIPAWMSNMASTESPYTTLFNLRKMVSEEKYKNSKIEGIVE